VANAERHNPTTSADKRSAGRFSDVVNRE